MRFGPKEIIDKNGRKIILRNAEVEDAEALIEYLKVTTGETPFFFFWSRNKILLKIK